MRVSLNTFWIAPIILVGSVAGWQAQAADIDFEGLTEEGNGGALASPYLLGKCNGQEQRSDFLDRHLRTRLRVDSSRVFEQNRSEEEREAVELGVRIHR